MGKYIHVSSHIEPDDELSVWHYATRPDSFGGEIPESVHVGFGNVNVWGAPERMADVLSEALTRVQSIMDAKEENG